jgi:hypothetical protein
MLSVVYNKRHLCCVTYKPFMLSVVYAKCHLCCVPCKPFMLSVDLLNVVMLSVMAPFSPSLFLSINSKWLCCKTFYARNEFYTVVISVYNNGYQGKETFYAPNEFYTVVS